LSQAGLSSSAPAAEAEDESPAWDKLAADTGEHAARADTDPTSGRRSSGSRNRLGYKSPLQDRRRLWWIVGGVAAGVCLVLALLIWLALRSSRDTGPRAAPPSRPTVFVNRLGKEDSAPSLNAALRRLRGMHQGGRIVLQQEVEEEEVLVDFPNVTIESEDGRPVTWKPPLKPTGNRLLRINNAADFHLKNVRLDGDNKVEGLVSLFGNCPGTSLERVHFKGMKSFGVWVVNCAGGEAPSRQVSLRGLVFETQRADQVGIFFDFKDNIPLIPKNRDFVIRDCTFGGPGGKIRATYPGRQEHIDLPEGMQIEPVPR
jgi:hypothetical protein